MPHPKFTRTAALLLALLLPGPSLAQAEPQSVVPAPADTAPALPAASGSPAPTPETMSTPAQQAVLDRIRFLRDGDQRRFGSCSYRWDRWKLLADGNRTTTYSCEGTPIADRTIGVNCSKLQINSYDPVSQPSGKGKGDTKTGDKAANGWAWGTWRLPKPGGEEQMVATLCANALPPPPAPAVNPSSPPEAKPAAAAKR